MVASSAARPKPGKGGGKGNGMADKTGLSRGALATIGGTTAVAAVAGVIGWQVWRGDPPVPAAPLPVAALPATSPAPVPATPPAPVNAPVAAADPATPAAAEAPPVSAVNPAPEPAPEPVAVAQAEAPRFDTFRLGTDGTAVVAGVAPEAAEVLILVDGAEVARAGTDRTGRFAAVFALTPAPQARALTLRSLGTPGGDLDSSASLMIAPALAALAGAAVPATPVAADPVVVAPAVVPVPLPGLPSVAELAVASPAPAADPAPPVAVAAPAPPPVAGAVTPAPAPVAIAAPAAAPTAVTPAPEPAPAPAVVETPPVAAQPTPRPDPAPVPVQPSNLLVSETGVTVLRPTPDRRMVIDSISYSASGAVEVAGKGAGGARIRLYLNNAVQFDTLADVSGDWRGTLPPVAPGLYTLRADQLDASGKVLERSETPFLREAPEALIAAAGPTPAPGAAPQGQVVTVQPGYTLWGIARQTYGEGVLYVKVFEANRAQIRNPDLIYPGQVFALPAAD